MRPRSPGPAQPLTPEQRKRFDADSDVAMEAVDAAIRAAGVQRFRHHAWEDLVQIASLAAMEAIMMFDPSLGSSFRKWAFFKAMNALGDAARGERRAYAKVTALIRASAMAFLGETEVEIDLGFETEDSLTGKLHGFTSTMLGLALLHVATSKPTTGGEDEAGELQAARAAGEALREVLPAAGTVERRMLEMRFVDGMPLTKVAAAMGVDKPGYQTFLRRFYDVVGRIGEGLAGRGIEEMPPWMRDVSGSALED